MAGSIFITGASGFLGRRLLPLLSADRSRRIVCLCRSKPVDPRPDNVEFVTGDLLEHDAYAEAIAGCDGVVHLAAATGKHSLADYMRINRNGTEVLVHAARRANVKRFLHVSTIAVRFSDESRYYYAQSKQKAESLVRDSGMRWTIVRPTMIFGKDAPVLHGLSRLAALPIVPIFGDGRTPVQPIFVDDLAHCLVEMLEDECLTGRTVEMGGPEVLSIEDLLLRIRRSLGKGDHVIHLPARPIAATLAWVEPLLRSLLPFTAGQLASFTNPGTISSDPWVEKRQRRMKNIAEMLES
jgi:nucleoside-diphosphate-sugar epimerase